MRKNRQTNSSETPTSATVGVGNCPTTTKVYVNENGLYIVNQMDNKTSSVATLARPPTSSPMESLIYWRYTS